MSNPAFIFVPPSNTGLPGGIPTANTIEYFEKGIDEGGPYYLVQYYINNWQDSDTFINALLRPGSRRLPHSSEPTVT